MEQNREPINKPKSLWSINIQQSGQKHKMEKCSFTDKYHPDKEVANCMIKLLNDNAVFYLRQNVKMQTKNKHHYHCLVNIPSSQVRSGPALKLPHLGRSPFAQLLPAVQPPLG